MSKPRMMGKRMVRVGKWTGEASEAARRAVACLLRVRFGTRKVWSRREHGRIVVAALECPTNSAMLEGFRSGRTMVERFQFTEVEGGAVEVALAEV